MATNEVGDKPKDRMVHTKESTDKKQPKSSNKSKRWVILSLVSIIGIVAIAVVLFFINQPTPVGTDDTKIVYSDPYVKESRQHNQDVLMSDGSVKKTDDQLYLKQVFVPLPRDKGGKEFPEGGTLFNTLVKSLESGHIEDINQGAAIFRKNTENYTFTTPKNLITAAIGNDLILYDEYNQTVDGVSKASRGKLDSDLGTKVLKSFKSPISIALVGSRLLPIAHTKFVIDEESQVMDHFLYEPSWYQQMQQFYPGDSLDQSTQKEKIQEIFDRYTGKLTSVFQVKLVSKFGPEVDVLLFEDGEGYLFVYGFYYVDTSNNKQTLSEYQNSEYSTFDNFTQDDLNWNTFQKGFEEIYNQKR